MYMNEEHYLQAEVSTTDQDQTKKTYIGMTSNKFKQRYRNHEKSFNNEKYKNKTELSKYIWKLINICVCVSV